MQDKDRVKLSADGRAIEIRRGSNCSLYEIDLRQISSAGELVEWWYHLHEKVDMNPEILYAFMVAVKDACSRQLGVDPRDVFTGGKPVEWK